MLVHRMPPSLGEVRNRPAGRHRDRVGTAPAGRGARLGRSAARLWITCRRRAPATVHYVRHSVQ
ncbi:hypothetical protein FMEAI12_3090009 [Parafrankia sp. Ea1.12]|nr:hypothetical protein FMEAI12_3090009 [Parafrankia sp. Ea1.12]